MAVTEMVMSGKASRSKGRRGNNHSWAMAGKVARCTEWGCAWARMNAHGMGQLVKRFAQGCGHARAQGGEAHALGVAFEQGGAQVVLQGLDVGRDRARRDAELFGCGLEAAQPGRRLEGAQGVERWATGAGVAIRP